MSVAELRRWCGALDPDPRTLGRSQLIRAIETALLTGQRIERPNAMRARSRCRAAPHYLVVDPGPAAGGTHRDDESTRCSTRAGWTKSLCSMRTFPRTRRRGKRADTRPCGSSRAASSICHPRGSGSLLRRGSTRSGSVRGSGISSAILQGNARRSRPARLAGNSAPVVEGDVLKIGITCYPTYGGSGAVATELGIALAGARARSPFHHLPAAVPASVVSAAHFFPRSRCRPVSAVRVSAVRSRARGAHARSRSHSRARAAALPLRHPARDQRVDRARDAARDAAKTST